MTIKTGDKLPDAKLRVATEDGPAWKTTEELFQGKKVVLIGVPGAFTSTCHNAHLPGYLQTMDTLRQKGVSMVAVTAVNDLFVMEAWKRASGADGKIEFLADGNGDFAKALGLTFDGSAVGLGLRSQRYSMLIEDGVVKQLNIETMPAKVAASSAETLLSQI